MCKGQMVGAEDSLLGRPFTSRLTAKTLDCKLYSCSILVIILNIPYIYIYIFK